MNTDHIPTIGEWYERLPTWQQAIFALLCLSAVTQTLAIRLWYGKSKRHFRRKR